MQPTSILANNHANKSGLKAAHADKIVEALKVITQGTAFEISVQANMKSVAVSRRLSELEKQGIVYSKGVSNKSESGRVALVWHLNKQPLTTWLNGTTSLKQGKMFE